MPANLIRWITRLLLAGFLVLLLATLVMQRRRILELTGEVATLREATRDVAKLRQENADSQLRMKLDEHAGAPPISPDSNTAPAQQVRTFKVNKAAMLALATDGQPGSATNYAAALKLLFTKAGVGFEPPNNFYYKDTEGMLMVRATLPDLDAIERQLIEFNLNAPDAPTR